MTGAPAPGPQVHLESRVATPHDEGVSGIKLLERTGNQQVRTALEPEILKVDSPLP